MKIFLCGSEALFKISFARTSSSKWYLSTGYKYETPTLTEDFLPSPYCRARDHFPHPSRSVTEDTINW